MSFRVDKSEVEGGVMVLVNFIDEYDVGYLGCEECLYEDNHYRLYNLNRDGSFVVQERFVKDISVVDDDGEVVGIYDSSGGKGAMVLGDD